MAKPKILCVDDDKDILGVLEGFLSNKYTVFLAEDGTQALDIFRQNKDITKMTLDIRMPGVSCMDLAQIAKKERPDTKVYIISAYLNPEAVKECQRVGIDAYLRKPFSSEDLTRILEENPRGYEK